MNKNTLIFLLLFVFAAAAVYAQTTELPERPVFFVSPAAEFSGYGREGMAIGAGAAVGMGDDRINAGLSLLYFKALGEDSINSFETTVFLKFFPFNNNVLSPLFFRLEAGAALFAYQNAPGFLSDSGSLVFGAGFGRQFPLNDRWIIEPCIRFGYPYIMAAGASAVFKF